MMLLFLLKPAFSSHHLIYVFKIKTIIELCKRNIDSRSSVLHYLKSFNIFFDLYEALRMIQNENYFSFGNSCKLKIDVDVGAR